MHARMLHARQPCASLSCWHMHAMLSCVQCNLGSCCYCPRNQVLMHECALLPAAMSNMCRDEITATLKNKIDSIFGSSFNTNGLGGVLTCGMTGMKAGLSHSPISLVGRPPAPLFSAGCMHA